MKKRYKVYKVLSQRYHELASSDVNHPAWRLSYAPGKQTKAKPGSVGIFVFTTLKDARIYTCNLPCYEAWTEAEPQRISRIGRYDSFWRDLNFRSLYKFLHKSAFLRRVRKANAGYIWQELPPRGCHVVPELTLGEKVS